MKIPTLLIVLLLPSLVYAQEVCVTVDTSSWTQEQKNWRQGITYWLAFNVGGQDVVPTINGDSICFTSPTFDVPTVITGTALLNRMAQQEADNNAELASLQILRNELNTITSQIESDDTNWGSLNTTQRLTVMKKILRREVLKQKLGQ